MASMRPSSRPRRPADRGRASRRIYQSVSDKRSVLAHLDLAKRSSKATITRKINQARRELGVPSTVNGAALKNSMLAFADMAGVDNATWNRLNAMDTDVIARLYEDSSLTFDVYFNYEGFSNGGGFQTVSEETQTNIDFFLDQYERYRDAGL